MGDICTVQNLMETNCSKEAPVAIKLPKKDKIKTSRTKTFLENIDGYFREYSEATGIHGVRYIAEKRTIIEKIIWFVVLAVAFAGCTFMILEIYQKWESSPVIVVFATKETPILKIPFPAVTICPEIKIKKEIFDYTATNQKLNVIKKAQPNESTTPEITPLTEQETKYLNYMSMICDVNAIEDKLDELTNDFYDFLLNSTDFGDVFFKCKWMGLPINCEKFFMPVVTDEGLCFTFNMLDRSDMFQDTIVNYKNLFQNKHKTNWTVHKGYPPITANTFYGNIFQEFPRRALYSGAKNALVLVLKASRRDMDYMCKYNPKGFKVSLHSPIRYPVVGQQYFKLPLDSDVISAIKPEVITTSEAVKKYDPEKRKCFYENERQLDLFKFYTQANCQLECLNNITKSNNFTNFCSLFYVPRENGTTICAPSNDFILHIADFLQKKNNVNLQLDNESNNAKENEVYGRLFFGEDNSRKLKFGDCNCLPLCTDISYNVEISQSKWDWKELYKSVKNKTFDKDASMSKLTLYFKSSHFVASERHELYGPSDFLSNFGGLLGLFTGFSIISVFEVFYFLSLRIWCNLRLYGFWAGPQKEPEGF